MFLNIQGLKCYIVEETTPGALTGLNGGANGFLVLRDGVELPSQSVGYTALKEVSDSRSIMDHIKNVMEAGSFNLPTFIRPSGTPGAAPAEALLVEGLLGAAELNAEDVIYTPAVAKKSYSIYFFLNGDYCVAVTGAAITGGKFGQKDPNSAVEADFKVSFMGLIAGGVTTLAEATEITDTVLTVAAASQFTVGARIIIGSDEGKNGQLNGGHLITAIDTEANTITVASQVGYVIDSGAVVKIYKPAHTNIGAPLKRRLAIAIDGNPLPWKSWEVNIEDPVAYLTEVPADPTTLAGPTGFVAEAGRQVSAKVSAIMRPDYLAEFQFPGVSKQLSIYTSDEAGKGFQIEMEEGYFSTPELAAGNGGAVERTLNYSARATDGEDEIFIKYS